MSGATAPGSRSESLVQVEHAGPVATITLDRPAALNALSEELCAQLDQALAAAEAASSIRAVVIAGSERAFCAGADISRIQPRGPGDMLDPGGFGLAPFITLAAMRKPVIAAVRGLALGGGCELALACDIVVASESARFAVPEVKLGVIPGAGGTQRLVHAVGKAVAMRMLLTGAVIDAQEALRTGLVSDLTPDEECLPTAMRLAEQIAGNAPLAVQLAKDAALGALQLPLDQGLALERRNFYLTFGTEDAKEGVSAFRDKRPPRFAGR